MSNWRGIVSFMGHTFYVLNAGTTATWVYDLDSQIWTRWSYQNNNTFSLRLALLVEKTNSFNTYFALTGSSSTIYKFDESLYQDSELIFQVKLLQKLMISTR